MPYNFIIIQRNNQILFITVTVFNICERFFYSLIYDIVICWLFLPDYQNIYPSHILAQSCHFGVVSALSRRETIDFTGFPGTSQDTAMADE